MPDQELLEFIKEYEGWSAYPYRDPVGIWTIGYGHNLEARGIPASIAKAVVEREPITRAQGDDLLITEVAECISHAKRIVKAFPALSRPRQMVVIDMIFNLGARGFSQFGQTIEHIEAGEYEDAARHMEASLWYRQVKDRAKRNCRIMRSGKL